MELRDARQLFEKVRNEIIAKFPQQTQLLGIRLEFDKGKTRFGVWKESLRTIGLSKALVLLNEPARVENTIRHEFAHAIAGARAGHNFNWVATARSIGCDGQACYNGDKVNRPAAAWIGTCPGCGKTQERHILTAKAHRVACSGCCRGVYNPAFKFVWTRNRSNAPRLATRVVHNPTPRVEPTREVTAIRIVHQSQAKCPRTAEQKRASALKAWETMRARKARQQ